MLVWIRVCRKECFACAINDFGVGGQCSVVDRGNCTVLDKDGAIRYDIVTIEEMNVLDGECMLWHGCLLLTHIC